MLNILFILCALAGGTCLAIAHTFATTTAVFLGCISVFSFIPDYKVIPVTKLL
jgi:hypothetical protein